MPLPSSPLTDDLQVLLKMGFGTAPACGEFTLPLNAATPQLLLAIRGRCLLIEIPDLPLPPMRIWIEAVPALTAIFLPSLARDQSVGTVK